MPLTPEQIAAAREKYGITPSSNPVPQHNSTESYDSFAARINAAASGSTSTPTTTSTQLPKKGFISAVGDVLNKRAEDINPILDRYNKNKQGKNFIGQTGALAQAAFQGVGNAAGAVNDIMFEGAKRLLPSAVKEPIKAGINAVASTKTVQDQAAKLAKWAEQHPDAAANLQSVVDISSLLPVEWVLSKGAGAVERGAGKAATVLEESAVKTAAKESEALAKKLALPVRDNAVKLSEVGRTTETGSGIFKRSVVEPTALEKRSIEALKDVPGIDSKKTFQQNYNIIAEHNKGLAQSLEADVKANNFIISKKETISRLNKAAKNLSNNPVIVGDAEKTAQKLLNGAKKFVNENPGTAEGIFKARKDFDAWVLSQKPKAFDAKAENAFTAANREIRNSMNDILEEKAPNIAFKQRLSQQHAIYNALDNLAPKAAEEANSAFGRLVQKIGKTIGIRNTAMQQAAGVLGLGGLAAGSAAFAGPAAMIGIPSFIVYKGSKALMSPEARNFLAKSLRQIERAAKVSTDSIEIKALNDLQGEVRGMLDQHEGFMKLPGVDPRKKELQSSFQRLQVQKNKLLNSGVSENSPQIKNIIKSQQLINDKVSNLKPLR